MQDHERILLTTLLTRQSVLVLAVVVDDAPVVGQLPFVMQPDFGALLVHASSLARHSRGLAAGSRYSVLIQAPLSDELDPFQRPRVSLEGRVRPLERGSEIWQSCRDRFLARLPSAEVTFTLGDFTLHQLVIEKGRFISGFGGAHTLNPEFLAGLASSTTLEAES